MKKHLVLIVNIVLILAIGFGIGIAVYNSNDIENTSVVPTEAMTEAATEAETEPLQKYRIGIIQHSNIENCNNAYQGFIAQLASEGYVNNHTIDLDYVLEEDSAKCEQEIQRMIDEKCDLIYAIGPFTAKLAASKTTEIPIVFGAVSDPEEEGLVASNETPKGNVTGVSDYTPCFEQIDSIKTLLPGKKKIGAIYTATSASSVRQAIIAEKEAGTNEVNIPYAKYPVKSADEISSSLEKMITDGVDVIYAPIDNLVYKNIKTLVDFSYENKIPIVCGNTKMLSKGCFSTCVINYSSVGKEAGKMALSILQDGAKPESMPVAYTYDCYLHINKSAADSLGVSLSGDVMLSAIME